MGIKLKLVFIIILIISILPKGIAQEATGKFKTVVIDAGHGGKDPGAKGKYCNEKDVVLAVALKVGNYIEKYLPEVNVVYTRKTDVFVPLKERANIANKCNANLFISIHANYISNPRIIGTETFALGLHRTEENLEVAKKENSVIVLEDDYSTTYEDFDPNLAESYIIFELYQNIYLDQSLEMAKLVEDQFSQRVGRRDRGVKQAGFLVLRETTMPGILIELGFLSNRNEEKYLTSNDGQSLLASGIFRAFRDYKDQFEAKNNLGVPVKLEADKTIEADSAILFRIQVAASKRKIKEGTGIYKDFDDVFEYKDGKNFKYTIGKSKSYDEIKDMLSKVRENIKDSFIVAFENGVRIPLDEARDKTHEKKKKR